jgi:hypothetical protein
MPEISVPRTIGDNSKRFKVSVPKARVVTKEGDWNIPVRMENMPLAVYGPDGILKEVITRTGRPVDAGGSLWAYKYRGDWFSTTLDPVFKFGTLHMGKQHPMKKGGSHSGK